MYIELDKEVEAITKREIEELRSFVVQAFWFFMLHFSY